MFVTDALKEAEKEIDSRGYEMLRILICDSSGLTLYDTEEYQNFGSGIDMITSFLRFADEEVAEYTIQEETVRVKLK